MHFSLLMPMRAVKHYDRWIGEEHLVDLARFAEDAGFDAIATTDHPFPPDSFLAQGGHHSFDPLVSLAFMASSTTRIRLLTYILVSAYRSPYVTSKALATLDILSGGRVIAGLSAGYLRGEFEALGAPWAERGARLDAGIDAMRAAWSGESVDHDGLFPAHGNTQLPVPRQPGGPPIWIGGNSRAAQRRAVERAQGWMPIGQSEAVSKLTGTPPLETIDQLAALIADVRRMEGESGKGPIDVNYFPDLAWNDPSAWSPPVAADLNRYEDIGVTWLTIEPQSRSFLDLRDAVGRFADEVLGRRLGAAPI